MFATDFLEGVAFRGDRLTLVWQDGEPYVALRPICERLGLNWASQHRKLTAPDYDLTVHLMTTVGGDAKYREMVSMHVVDLPLWLASISPAKVKPEVREALVTYRRECALVLFEHVKGRLLGERDAAVTSLVRLREELLARRPRLGKIRAFVQEGWDFEKVWRASRLPRMLVAEVIGDLERLGLIEEKPAGFPACRALQGDLFQDA